MVKILEVKKAYRDMAKNADFVMESVSELIEMAERKKVKVIYKKGDDHLLIDYQQNYYYAKG